MTQIQNTEWYKSEYEYKSYEKANRNFLRILINVVANNHINKTSGLCLTVYHWEVVNFFNNQNYFTKLTIALTLKSAVLVIGQFT